MATETELGGYLLSDKIAVGGMAEVYRAKAAQGTQRGADEPADVVLKRLLPTFRAEQAFVNLFVAEGKLCVRLKHPNVVRTFKLFKKGTDYFMVQELVDGMTLAKLAERARAAKKPVKLSAAVYSVQGLLRGLEYIHKLKLTEAPPTIVHGDVNPANVLISRGGEVKITDFGVAMSEGVPAVGEGGSVRGTLTYMSPEQVLGKPVDKRSDLFAAGVILWELVANQLLVDAPTEYEALQRVRECRVPLLNTVRPDVPDLLVQIVRKACYADANLRFADATEFLRALEVLGQRASLTLAPTALSEELGR